MSPLFSRDEAEQLLPRLIPQLEAMRSVAHELDAARARLEDVPEASRQNGRAGEAARLEREIVQHAATLRTMMAELEALGVEVKDVRTGLIDFRSERDGQVVYLCWRLGEPRILYWHHLDAGFAGREPLDP